MQQLRKKFSPSKNSEPQRLLREKPKSDVGDGMAANESGGLRMARDKRMSVPAAAQQR